MRRMLLAQPVSMDLRFRCDVSGQMMLAPIRITAAMETKSGIRNRDRAGSPLASAALLTAMRDARCSSHRSTRASVAWTSDSSASSTG